MSRKKVSKSKKILKKNKKTDDKKRIELLKLVIEGLINKQSAIIIDLLEGKKNVNEFVIAKKLKLTINQTRNILYKLSDYGLVSFIRKKDRKRGWYIYFWTFNPSQAISLLESNLKKKLDGLEIQLKNRKERDHYFCPTCSIEVDEEIALLNNFTCTECDGVYKLVDNTKAIEDINKEISKIKKDLSLVLAEKEKEESEKKKKDEKRMKKEKRKEEKIKRKLTKIAKLKKKMKKIKMNKHKIKKKKKRRKSRKRVKKSRKEK